MIWIDSILSFKRHHPAKSNWKFTLFFYNTWINALNLWIILLWLKYFKILVLPSFNINIFPGELLNNFIAFTIQFAAPFAILNYFLIFHKERYKSLVEKYKNYNGKYALIYSIVIALLAFISAILYGLLK